MNKDALTAPEVAKLLGIAPNTVYAMVKRGELNCYMVGRKMRFTYEEIQRHRSGGTDSVQKEAPKKTVSHHLSDSEGFRICGKDEILNILASAMNRRDPDLAVECADRDSYNSLIALYHDKVIAAACHIWDNRTDTYNRSYIRAFVPGCRTAIIHVAKRVQGFYVAKGNPKRISGWEDLRREDLTLANREPGAGTRILLDLHLEQLGIDPSTIRGYGKTCNSHLGVASAVAKGTADLGIGTEKTACNMTAIDFVPLQQEEYDLVVKAENLSHPGIQLMIELLQSEEFREQFQFLSGYDVSCMGQIEEV